MPLDKLINEITIKTRNGEHCDINGIGYHCILYSPRVCTRVVLHRYLVIGVFYKYRYFVFGVFLQILCMFFKGIAWWKI